MFVSSLVTFEGHSSAPLRTGDYWRLNCVSIFRFLFYHNEEQHFEENLVVSIQFYDIWKPLYRPLEYWSLLMLQLLLWVTHEVSSRRNAYGSQSKCHWRLILSSPRREHCRNGGKKISQTVLQAWGCGESVGLLAGESVPCFWHCFRKHQEMFFPHSLGTDGHERSCCNELYWECWYWMHTYRLLSESSQETTAGCWVYPLSLR